MVIFRCTAECCHSRKWPEFCRLSDVAAIVSFWHLIMNNDDAVMLNTFTM